MPSSVLVVCPHCHTANRVPEDRLGDGAVCGRCKSALFAGQVVELDAASFEKHLLNSDIPLVVDFWAPWCGPCRQMAPLFAQAAGRLEPRYRLAKVNAEAEQALTARFGIQSIPAFIVFHRGAEVARTSGGRSLEGLVRWIRSAAG